MSEEDFDLKKEKKSNFYRKLPLKKCEIIRMESIQYAYSLSLHYQISIYKQIWVVAFTRY